MAAFLLWNVNRKPLDSLVQNLARQYQIDVVLLVEYPFGDSQLPGLLMTDGLIRRPSLPRFGVFVRDTHRFRLLNYNLGRRANVWAWVPPSGQEGTVVLVHGFDRRNYDDSTRRGLFRRIREAVERREVARAHRRTVLAGDFNAHPFDSAMAASDGLHAIGVRSVGANVSRRDRGTGAATDFFYNPMWRVYGQWPESDAGAATHSWLGQWSHEVVWHMLDQVLLRPGESVNFPKDRLQIVTRVGAISLLDTDGVPDAQTASDHLPVVFHWDL